MSIESPPRFQKITQSVDFMEKCNSLKDMANKRMSDMNIKLKLNYKNYSAGGRAGYSNVSNSSSKTESHAYSYLLEERVFQVRNIM